MIRRAIWIVAGLEAVAVAIWLIPASIHIVAWGVDGPRRIGLFASRASLLWLVAGALVGAAILTVRLKPDATATRRFAWLSLLWLWVVPFLPWLPDRIPLLLLLAGPLRWIVAAVAIGNGDGGIFSWLAKKYPRPHFLPGRRAVFVTSLVVYLVLGALHARAIGPGGDEPHYLVIAHSLLVDHDLLIENNHTRRDYLAFFGGPLRPDYMRRGQNGEIYSIHAPGLPVLVLPAYAIAGYAGVVAFLCFLAALTALAVFDVAAAIAGPRAGLIAWAAMALTVPFLPHSWLIFPELPGALIVAWAALWVWRSGAETSSAPTTSVAAWLWRGSVLATLPWLHTKFIIFLAVFGGALFLRVWRRPKAATVFVAPIAVSLAGWLGYFYAIYGTINPEAPYGAYTAVNVVARNIPRGLLGLMVDQKFGLLVYSPIYLFAIAGAWMMVRSIKWRWLAAVLLAAVALHAGSTTRLYMWWGGNSAPARFLVPILPCLAPMIAVAVNRLRAPAPRAVLWIAGVVSLTVAFAGTMWPARLLLFSDPRGKARLVELLQGPAPLTSILPTFTQEDWRSPLLNTMAMRVVPSERAEVARRGVMDLLRRYDAQRLRAVEYASLRKLDQPAVLGASTLVVERAPLAGQEAQRMIAGPFTLPAGSYETRFWLGEVRPLEREAGGEFVVSSTDRAIFARRANTGNPVTVTFELPVAVNRLTLSATSPQLAGAVVKAEIAPKAIVAPRDREQDAVRAIESVPGHPGAYLVYFNEHAYPEGGVFWTRGTGRASVAVSAPGAHRLTLLLDSGPRENEIRLTVGGSARTIRTAASAVTTESFDISPAARLIPITVEASSFFRPAEIDRSSSDNRGLGCHVRINLE